MWVTLALWLPHVKNVQETNACGALLFETVSIPVCTPTGTSTGNALVGFHTLLVVLATVVTTRPAVTVRVILTVAGVMIRQILDWVSVVKVVSLHQGTPAIVWTMMMISCMGGGSLSSVQVGHQKCMVKGGEVIKLHVYDL